MSSLWNLKANLDPAFESLPLCLSCSPRIDDYQHSSERLWKIYSIIICYDYCFIIVIARGSYLIESTISFHLVMVWWTNNATHWVMKNEQVATNNIPMFLTNFNKWNAHDTNASKQPFHSINIALLNSKCTEVTPQQIKCPYSSHSVNKTQ